MIYIHNINVYGIREATIAARNPYDSWLKSDSTEDDNGIFTIGENDKELLLKLAKAGTDHGKYLRMITLYCDILAPMYWWKEYDTYKVGTVANSSSTMHTITKYPFDRGMFSVDGMTDESLDILDKTIDHLNLLRDKHKEAIESGQGVLARNYWYDIIKLLPSSFQQYRSVTLNYAVLRNIYFARKNHRLKEWNLFCDRIESLPYSELIINE